MFPAAAATSDTAPIALRPVTDDDGDFLLRVYAGTRAEELSLVDWTDVQREAFVRMQFDAQASHYRQHKHGASFDVITVGGQPAGRLYVDRGQDEIRIVDISLLPEFRNAGVGEHLLRQLIDEAASSGRTLSIHVEIHNPAARLYSRLGFVPVAEHGVYRRMEWTQP